MIRIFALLCWILIPAACQAEGAIFVSREKGMTSVVPSLNFWNGDEAVAYVEALDRRLRRAMRALNTEYSDITPDAEVAARVDRVVEDAAALANDCRQDLEQALVADGEKVTSANLS